MVYGKALKPIWQNIEQMFIAAMLVGPRALEQLVSLERLTYVAYFVLLTCF